MEEEKNTAETFLAFFLLKIAIYLFLGLLKGRLSYRGEAFNSQRRTSRTSKT
jgi:hypothetical protein